MVGFEQVQRSFGIGRGMTALIGGGGKSTLLLKLSEELCPYGSVLLTTGTHFYPPSGVPFSKTLERPLAFGERLTVGTPCEDGKLTVPKQPFETLCSLADFVLVEADGARGMPLKAHAAHEPAVPDGCRAVLAVVGLDGIGKRIREAAHRPALYAARLGVSEETVVSPALAAKAVCRYPGVTGVVLNKADTPERLALARETARLLPGVVLIAALQSDIPYLEIWRNGTCWLS